MEDQEEEKEACGENLKKEEQHICVFCGAVSTSPRSSRKHVQETHLRNVEN